MSARPPDIEYAASRPGPISTRRDELAYVLPMAAFLLFTWAGGHWEAFFPLSYVIKTLAAGALLVFFWKHYTKVRWDFAWLGVVVGIVGLFQWVGMEELLRRFWVNYPRIPGGVDYNPYDHFHSPALLWTFIIIRWIGPTLVVPFMEELFWRDYLWRTIAAPNDFKLAKVGEWDPKAFFIVALMFASVHPMWMTAIVWGLMIGALLLYTRSLGACIIAHAVTNLLLGGYVLWTGKWYYW